MKTESLNTENKVSPTPGYWKVIAGNIGVESIICPDDGGNVICIEPEGLTASLTRWPANAQLIAAAPELLEALEHVARYFQDFPCTDQLVVDRLINALLNAKGGQI